MGAGDTAPGTRSALGPGTASSGPLVATSSPPPPHAALRLYAIPLGLAGLGGAWSAATTLLDAPRWPQELGYAASVLVWLALSATYVGERVRHPSRFRVDRQDPTDGPGAAQPPLIAILLTAHYAQYLPVAGTWLCWLFVAALAVVDAQLFGYWLSHGVALESLHPGYSLPLIAGPFIASIALGTISGPGPAIAALGVGAFFWLIIGGIISARLIIAAPLSPSGTPSLAILLAPAATGGIAAIQISSGLLGPLEYALVGIFLTMLAIQLALLPRYGRLSFSLAFWSFTFPAASSANFTERWLGAWAFPAWQSVAWAVLGIATAIVLGIAARTLLWLGRRPA